MTREQMTRELDRIQSAGGKVDFWYDLGTKSLDFRLYGKSGMQAAWVRVVEGDITIQTWGAKVTETMKSFLRAVAVAYASDLDARHA